MIKVYLYWIKRKSHTNILTEGYVGISEDPVHRFYEHKNFKGNSNLKQAFGKYQDIDLKIVCQGTIHFCKFLENRFRPIENIGWNIASGGGIPPKQFGNKHRAGKKLSIEHKLAISNGVKGLKRSLETRAKMSLAQLGNKKCLGKKKKPHSEATKLKISQAKIGSRHTLETRMKMSESHRTRGLK